MRLTRLVGLGVALATAVGAAGAQQPSGTPASAPPELTLWSPSSQAPLLNAGPFQNFYVSVDRDAYVAALEVARDGRMRVLYPRSPKDAAAKVKAGKTVALSPWSYDLLGLSVTPAEVPYVIALASDEPIDLSRFGQGKTWQYRVRVERARYAEETMDAVARLVATDSAQRFAADFGYVAPRISPSLQTALARCTSLTSFSLGRDQRDYWLYRDLWMSFGPRDGYWLASVSPWLGWGWNGLAPMLFPSVAAWPTRGGGCSPTLRLPAYAVAPETYNRIQRPDTVRRDSTMTDTARAAAAGGRTIAVEQPSGAGSRPEAFGPGERRAFSPAEIARVRSEFYAEPNGNPPRAEMTAAQYGARPVDRRGGGWSPEPIDARPTSRGAGGSRYAEQAERGAQAWPSAGVGPRSGGARPGSRSGDPVERARSGAGAPGHTRASSPYSGGGSEGRAESPRASAPASPVTGGERGSGGASPRAGGSSSSSSSSSASSPAAPRGQQQQQD